MKTADGNNRNDGSNAIRCMYVNIGTDQRACL